MLIRFMVENFLSFRDEVEFSMVAGRSSKHPDHVVTIGTPKDLHLLKTAVLFGSNASGKTNLIKAMSFAQEFITVGSLETRHNKLTPFLLDNESKQKPSRFEFEIKCGIMMLSYRYGFLVDSKRVYSEWLYEIRSSSETMMFERETDSAGRTNVEIGEVNVLVTNEKEPFDFVRKFRTNELFLTAINTVGTAGSNGDDIPAVQMGENSDGRETRQFVRATSVTSFSPFSSPDTPKRVETRIAFLNIIYDWFNYALTPIFPDSIPTQGIGLGIMRGTDFKDKLKEVLDILDLGIDGVDLLPIEINAESDLSEEFRDFAKKNAQGISEGSDEKAIFGYPGNEDYILVDSNHDFSACKLVTLHNVKDEDRQVPFDLSAESDGTRRLLDLIPSLLGIHSNQTEHVFVIDELDRSMHAHLSCKVVELFLTNTGNKETQLIVTSHDTGLLDLDLLRRDEIWFIEKDRGGASALYSLEEFKLPENMNIEKGYVFGRFGAVPVIPSVNSLDWLREI